MNKITKTLGSSGPLRSMLLLVSLAFVHVAQAGFIDERKAQTAPPADAAPASSAAAVGPRAAETPAMQGAAGPSATVPALIPAGENRPYQLTGGKPIHTQLIDWAKSAGWVLRWSPQNTWEAFADTTIIAASADRAIEQVVENLRMEGKPIRLRVYAGNRVMEVEAMTIGD